MSFSSFELIDQSRPILVFGSDGQVGKALRGYLSELKASVVYLGRGECDLSNESSISQVLNKYQPQVIINS
jgi:dTDP-4-dehydrorhamnose reductase